MAMRQNKYLNFLLQFKEKELVLARGCNNSMYNKRPREQESYFFSNFDDEFVKKLKEF